MLRAGVGGWSSPRADKVQEKLEVHPYWVACAGLHRVRIRFGVFEFGQGVLSLAQGESRADFPEVSLQLLDPPEWKLTACGGFFREENITVLEARSILYAVLVRGNASSSFLTILRWCKRSAKDAQKQLHCF